MKSTESDVCYFEVDAVFNREPVELLEESVWTAGLRRTGNNTATSVCIVRLLLALLLLIPLSDSQVSISVVMHGLWCINLLLLCVRVCVCQRKCEQYWPETGSKTFNDLTVELVSTEQFADFRIRTFRLSKVRHSQLPLNKIMKQPVNRPTWWQLGRAVKCDGNFVCCWSVCINIAGMAFSVSYWLVWEWTNMRSWVIQCAFRTVWYFHYLSALY